MIKRLSVFVVLIFFELLIISQYLVYLADFVARYTGYFFSVGVLPFLVGVCVGLICLKLLSFPMTKKSLFKGLLIVLGFGLVALTPVFYTFLMFLNDGG